MSSRPAATGARDQVTRLLTLVPYLHAHGEVRLEEAATALGSSPEQLLADLKVLLMCGLPGGYPDDLIDVDLDALEGPEADGVIRVSNADYLARPMRLTPTEASAIIVALRALRSSAGKDTREVVDRALAKLEAAAAQGTPVPLVDPGDPGEIAGLARQEALGERLRRAAQEQRQVRLRYHVPSRDEESERTVDPRGMVTAGGLHYLDAWCHAAEAPRLFRLDRVREAEVLDSPIVTEPQPPRDLSDGLFAHASDVTRTTLLLDPPARWVVEYYPVERVRRRRDGRLEVELLVADERWLTRLLLRLAPHATVVGPEELSSPLAAAAAETARLYA